MYLHLETDRPGKKRLIWKHPKGNQPIKQLEVLMASKPVPREYSSRAGATREVLYCLMRMLLTQLCPVLCNLWTVALQDPGFSVHGILQARILQWVVRPSSRGSS